MLQWPIPNDLYGSYYWAASAYNAAGASGYSNEVFWTRDAPLVYVGATVLTASRYGTDQGVGMGFAYVATAAGYTSASGTSLATSTSLNVAAGDLLVVWVCWEDGTSTISASDGGSNTFTFEDTNTNGGNYGTFGYVLSASANSTATITVSWGTSRGYRLIRVFQFRPDSGETVTRDAYNTGSGSGTALASGTINTTGTDEVVIGGSKSYLSGAVSNAQIADTAAALLSSQGDGLQAMWYQVFTETLSGINAEMTGPNADYICNVIAFKSVSGGTSAVVWGEESPSEGSPESWSTWQTVNGDSPVVVGDSNWGKLNITGINHRGPVKDTGNSRGKRFVVKRDSFGTGLGTVNLYIRGSTNSFLANAETPTWELYSAPINRVWRYVQVRADKA